MIPASTANSKPISVNPGPIKNQTPISRSCSEHPKHFDWSASITLDRRLLDAAISLEILDKHEHVLLVGPAGVGKSFLA